MSVLDYSVVVQAVGSVELLSPDEVKGHLRIDHSLDDTEVAGLAKRARIQVEHDSRRQLTSHTFDFKYDRFPLCRYIKLTRSPLTSVTHLKYIDENGTLQTWDSSNYEVDTARDTIWLAWNVDWPAIRDIQNAVQIRAVFAHAATDEVVEYGKQAMLLLVGHWYRNREASLVGSISKEIEFSYTSIINRMAKASYP